MVIDTINLALSILSCIMAFWAHFGKNSDGKELSFRLKMTIYWSCLTLIGIINILCYVINDNHYVCNLVTGLISFIIVCVQAIIVVWILGGDLEESDT